MRFALVDADHDFSLDEEMIVDRDLLDYAKNETEAREAMRKQVKYALLVLRSGQQEKDAAEIIPGRNPAKTLSHLCSPHVPIG